MAYALKRLGKAVTFNDASAACHAAGVALIENRATRLDPADARRLFERRRDRAYARTVEEEFRGVFFLDDENRWIDVVAQNVAAMPDPVERALAAWSLHQACLMKRPFNLFHRRNLELRTRDVPRSFGNKATWERPFEGLFVAALESANRAVFDGGARCRATNEDATACPLDAELVYLDPPYVRSDGATFDYADGYHFLDGLSRYDGWAARLDRSKKHRPLVRPRSPFSDVRTARDALFELCARAGRSHLVISYREDGVPAISEIVRALERMGRRVTRRDDQARAYALSRRASREVTIVAPRPGAA